MVPSQAKATPGTCALLGSGETTGVGRRVLSALLQEIGEPCTIAVLDTPAGFQPNHIQVAEKIVHFIAEKLAGFHPRPSLVETRRTAFDTVLGTKMLATLARSRCIVAGPGSPTYMIRELKDTSYLDVIRHAHANGTAICTSSAASIALGAFSIPVYEIFKVGEDPHWRAGLDFFGSFGMSLAIVPHWNNHEGGAEVDTRFCYMGEARFEALRALLPPEIVILGIDEHSACIMDFSSGRVSIEGKGGAYIVRDGQLIAFSSGDIFPMSLLRAHTGHAQQNATSVQRLTHAEPLAPPATILDPRLEEDAWGKKIPPQLIDAVLAVRAELRSAKHWVWTDQLRDALTACGIVVEDTSIGSRWHVVEAD